MEGKVALITGGASGIGKAIAETLLEKGANVCILDVNEISGNKTQEELAEKYPTKIFFRKCDVTCSQELEECFKETIENAGIVDESQWKTMLNVNLTPVIDGTLFGIKYMKRKPGENSGVIINTSSIAGVLPVSIFPVYSAANAGIIGFTRSVGSVSLRLHGVRVNCITPGAFDTTMNNFTLDHVYDRNKDMLDIAQSGLRNPDNMISPKEVAECVVRLIEDDTLSGEVMLATTTSMAILKLPNGMEDLVLRE